MNKYEHNIFHKKYYFSEFPMKIKKIKTNEIKYIPFLKKSQILFMFIVNNYFRIFEIPPAHALQLHDCIRRISTVFCSAICEPLK